MAKRNKKIEKGAESLKQQIEKHFSEVEKDIKENRIERGRYHIKEIDRSLLKALELKMSILGIEDKSLKIYKERLERLKKKLNLI